MAVSDRRCLLLAAWCALAALPLARAMPVVAPVGAARDRSVERSFVVRSDAFWRNGQRVQVISGELHYFRVPRAYWRDRMARMRALGFNTIQTYVAWNYHEPVRGSIDWSGDRDVRRRKSTFYGKCIREIDERSDAVPAALHPPTHRLKPLWPSPTTWV